MSDLLDIRFLVRLAIDTVRRPKQGAAEILRIAPPLGTLWLTFALMVVVSLIMGELIALFVPSPESGTMAGQSALALGLIQGAMLFVMVHAITHIGRFFGGTGQFAGALALVTWLQFIFFLVQLVQVLLLLIAPVFAVLVMVVSIGLFFWLLINFIAVLHGFESLSSVLVMTIVSFISIIFILSLVLAALGFNFETQAVLNEL